MIIRPAKFVRGEVALPADKSISHRAAMIAAIANGESRIDNYATSADCASTLSCLRQLGVEIRQQGTDVSVKGVGLRGLRESREPLDCGNSGTTMRLLAGILAGQEFDSVLTGDESLQRRPMRRIAEPLNAMGASVETTDGHAPIKIAGGRRLVGIEHHLQIASAQIKSCILLAGLNADGDTYVNEPAPTRDHTERMLRYFGAPIDSMPGQLQHRVTGGRGLESQRMQIPGDVSAAAFFVAAAACLPSSDITMRRVGANRSRGAVISVFDRLGVRIEVKNHDEGQRYEPSADIRVRGGFANAQTTETIVLDGEVIPALIDELPIIAIAGSQHTNGIEVRDAAELRVKESDRIAAIVENLHRMQADVEEFPDGFRVTHSRLKGAKIDAFGDHRIAMAFAVAGLLAEGETEIVGSECAAVSFPEFFGVLKNVAVYE